MSSDLPIKLSRLRDIGWKEWDPIHLLSEGDTWDDQSFADEYDAYLLHIAAALRHGATPEDAATYLIGIEQDHMGLGSRPTQNERAEATVRAVQQYLAELDH